MFYRNVQATIAVLIMLAAPAVKAQDQEAAAAPSGEDARAAASGQTGSDAQSASVETSGDMEDRPASGPEPERQSEAGADTPCLPECRPGYKCASGVCVTSCNPPCGPGTVCTADRRCVTDAFLRVEPTTWEWPDPEHYDRQRERTVRNHDGFYLRYSAGLGYVFDGLDSPSDATIEGLGVGLIDLQIGGTPGKGFVFGLGEHFIMVPEPLYEDSLAKFNMSGRLRLNVLGPFVDFYPNPRSGLHFGATIGLGWAFYRVDRDRDEEEENDGNADDVESPDPGVGLSPTVGYDFWIDEQLSFGVLMRLIYIAADDEYQIGHSVLVPLLSATCVYH